MKIDSSKLYKMPLLMGPLVDKSDPKSLQLEYPEVEVVAIQFQTDAEALLPLLPDCYRPAKSPTVTVLFGDYNQLAFMAGRGYRIAAVMVTAVFDGEHDHAEGDYVLVMFEDQTWPIIGGREDIGIPKLYADISPIRLLADGRLRLEASYWGYMLFGIDLSLPQKQNPIVRLAAQQMVNSRPWLGYKYIPSLDGPPDADYPMITRNDTKIDELWFGKSAEIFWGQVQDENVGHVAAIISALKTLSIKKLERAIHFRGSSVLRYDLSHRLR